MDGTQDRKLVDLGSGIATGNALLFEKGLGVKDDLPVQSSVWCLDQADSLGVAIENVGRVGAAAVAAQGVGENRDNRFAKFAAVNGFG